HGEVIFDTGLVSGATLEWPWRNTQGETIESGLYAYTLTIKGAGGETARTQHGYVIVDRASRDDRVWVTSDSEVSLGGEHRTSRLTVTGTSEATVGGAQMPGESSRAMGTNHRST